MQEWSQEFRQENIDETRNYLAEVINRNELMNKKTQKGLCNSKLYWALFYFRFYNNWMCFYFCFDFLAGIPMGISSSLIGLRSCVITAVIKKDKSIIKKKNRKHDKIVL